MTAGFLLFSFAVFAQNSNSSPPHLKLFIDCVNSWCDMSYIKTEIKYVDYVNDRYAANVYVLITSSRTGGGGQEYKLYFEGLENFRGVNDTLSYIKNAVETNDEDRKKMVQVLKLGLIPFLARTPLGATIEVIVPESGTGEKNQQVSAQKDKWNSWVFSTGVNGNFNGNDNYNFSSSQLRFSAGRVTEKLKFSLGANYNRRRNKYIYNNYDPNTGELVSSDTTISKTTRSTVNSTLAVSLSNHFSAGLFSSYNSSTFDNIDGSFSLKPAFEYSIFPYKTFTTRYMGFLYRIGPIINNYVDTTWRNKTREWLLQQNLSFDLSFNQKWGTVSASLYWSNYFFDWKWHNYGFFGNGEFRVVKGLNFNFFTGISIIHDQVELQKGNATQTQVLIQQRLLRNTFDYFASFGLSYRFGSIYNNVVNPRLGDTGGGMFFISN